MPEAAGGGRGAAAPAGCVRAPGDPGVLRQEPWLQQGRQGRRVAREEAEHDSRDRREIRVEAGERIPHGEIERFQCYMSAKIAATSTKACLLYQARSQFRTFTSDIHSDSIFFPILGWRLADEATEHDQGRVHGLAEGLQGLHEVGQGDLQDVGEMVRGPQLRVPRLPEGRMRLHTLRGENILYLTCATQNWKIQKLQH